MVVPGQFGLPPLFLYALFRIKEFFKLKADRHISQQLIEDSFNGIKSAVDKKGNTMTNAVYAWSNLVDKAIMSKKYAFREVVRQPALPERNTTFAPETWTPVLKKAKLDAAVKDAGWHKVVGYGDAEWFSPGAGGYLAPYADLQAARDAHAADQLHMLGSRNYVRLVQKNVLLQKIGAGDGKWYLGIGDADCSVGIVFPVVEVEPGQFVPDNNRDKKLITILDPDAWRAKPVKWISPLHRAVVSELRDIGETSTSFREVRVKAADHYGRHTTMTALVNGPTQTLWQVAASQAFWNLPLTFLREMAMRRDIELRDTTLLSTLECLYRSAFPACSDEDVIKMLDLRSLAFEDDLSCCGDLVAMEDVCDSFDRSFGEQLLAEIRDAKAVESNCKDFAEESVKFKAQPFAPFCAQFATPILQAEGCKMFFKREAVYHPVFHVCLFAENSHNLGRHNQTPSMKQLHRGRSKCMLVSRCQVLFSRTLGAQAVCSSVPAPIC